MKTSFAPFDGPFQERGEKRAHPLRLKAQARLEERRADLKEACPSTLSCFTLQHINDLAARLARLYDSLPESGLFLGVLAGGETLCELRHVLMEAEIALTGGASPRIMPMMTLQELSQLLPAAGFAHSVVDRERLTLIYPDMFALMRDLRASGETNRLKLRSRRFAPRDLFDQANTLYKKNFPTPSGGIRVTVDLLYMHGWKETKVS